MRSRHESARRSTHDGPRTAPRRARRSSDRRRGPGVVTSAALALLGCTSAPSGVEPVRGFELERYLGTWYEIARLDHRFERGLEDISATYSLRSDGGIRVQNRGYDPKRGRWREAIGRAYPTGDASVASLQVSFFGPFYGGYHVIALDDAYQTALVSGPNRGYLWILARSKSIPAERRDALVAFAAGAGYEVEDLIWVDHARRDPALGPPTQR